MKPIPNMNECMVNSGDHSSYHFPARKLAIKFPEVLKGYTIRRNIYLAHYLKIISIIHNQVGDSLQIVCERFMRRFHIHPIFMHNSIR